MIKLPALRQTSAPWSSPGQWREALDTLAHLIGRHAGRLGKVQAAARRMEESYLALDGAMERLCLVTCPHCPEVCCGKAWIFYDLRDLLFLSLTGAPQPPGQIVRQLGGPCPHLGKGGCVLERVARPFACTWYLCPAQKGALAGWDQAERDKLRDQLEGVRAARQEMTAAFYEVINP
jgi:hypothetical protein